MKSKWITITAAQVKTLNATPIELVAAPGSGKGLVFKGAKIRKSAGTAYDGIAAGEDLAICYTNISGVQVGGQECTGFMDQTTTMANEIKPIVANLKVTPNAALVIVMLTGEIATGNATLKIQVEYDVINI